MEACRPVATARDLKIVSRCVREPPDAGLNKSTSFEANQLTAQSVERVMNIQDALVEQGAAMHGNGPSSPSYVVDQLSLPEGVADFAQAEIRFHDGQRCDLSGREAELLRYLAANSGRPVSRDEILERVWRLNPRRLITRTIDMHVAHLRDKLRDNPFSPRILFTVRGTGYMIATAVGG